jgi:hypothetical protein
MLFTDALKQLLEGNYVQRATWAEAGQYIVLMPNMNHIWQILVKPNPNAGNWLPSIADFNADDWELVTKSRIDEVIKAIAPEKQAA